MSDSPEVLFLRAYKNAIMHFNMLDRNLAYCLHWASINAGRELSLLTIFSYSYEKKLKKIACIIAEKGRISEYSKFMALADQCRTLRNKLVHGHWDFVSRLPKPIRFQIPAPFAEEGYLTHKEFATLVSPFAALSSQFIKLQQKHPIDHA